MKCGLKTTHVELLASMLPFSNVTQVSGITAYIAIWKSRHQHLGIGIGIDIGIDIENILWKIKHLCAISILLLKLLVSLQSLTVSLPKDPVKHL